MSKFITNLNPDKIFNENRAEFIRFISSIKTMEMYYMDSHKFLDKMSHNFGAIGEKFLSKMSYDYKERIKRVSESITLNQEFFNPLIQKYKPSPSYYEQLTREELNSLSTAKEKLFLYDSVFVYILRDWTNSCEKERDENYKPLIEEVKNYFMPGSGNYKFLIPGASLCRLGYEVAKLGFDVESNDYSFFNVIISDYLFNYCKKDQFTFQPLIHNFSDFLTEELVFQKFSFPNENIDLTKTGKMTMTYGDFVKNYIGKKEMYDCIITCFFIDTAKNVIEYIETIYNCLKKGGIWINFGPLSYHWAEEYKEISIELTYDKLKEVIINYGFEYLNEKKKMVDFGQVEGLLKIYKFGCIFFTVRKK